MYITIFFHDLVEVVLVNHLLCNIFDVDLHVLEVGHGVV